jgi:hypothetical protein
VTGWWPAEPRRLEGLLLARIEPNGSLEPAGSTPLVLANGQADEVRRQREPSSCRRLGAVSASAA